MLFSQNDRRFCNFCIYHNNVILATCSHCWISIEFTWSRPRGTWHAYWWCWSNAIAIKILPTCNFQYTSFQWFEGCKNVTFYFRCTTFLVAMLSILLELVKYFNSRLNFSFICYSHGKYILVRLMAAVLADDIIIVILLLYSRLYHQTRTPSKC